MSRRVPFYDRSEFAVRACRERVTFMLEQTPCPPSRVRDRAAGTTPREMASMRACVGCAAVLIKAKAQVALSEYLDCDLRWSPGAQVDVCCPQESEIGVAWERLQVLERLSDQGGGSQVHSDVVASSVRGGICGVSAGTARGRLSEDGSRLTGATVLGRVSEVAQAAADRGQLRLVYRSARTLRRRRPKALRSVTSAATSEQEVAGAWLRVFPEQLGCLLSSHGKLASCIWCAWNSHSLPQCCSHRQRIPWSML